MSKGVGGDFVLMMAAAFMSSTVIHKDCSNTQVAHSTKRQKLLQLES